MTHTRTHTFITFANPHLVCAMCQEPVPRWHDNTRCGCGGTWYNAPCGHAAGIINSRLDWSPVGEEEH